MKQVVLIVFNLVVLSIFLRAADDLYDSGFEPASPTKFPDAYKNYQILPDSFSPNKRYALIYPKRSILYDLKDYGLFLVELEPFRILVQIPLRYSNLAGNTHGWYKVNWAKNSSSVIAIEGTKWGPDKVYLIHLSNGQVGEITDLEKETRKQVQADYDKAKSGRYNKYFDYILCDNESSSWEFLDDSKVMVDCLCTNDPKSLDSNSWSVQFKGTWDVIKKHFIENHEGSK